jgi:hypothetical protein
MELEFEERSLKAGLAELDKQIKNYVLFMKEDKGLEHEARTVLTQLNKVKSSWTDSLKVNKVMIRTAHDTNELIIGNILHSSGVKINQSHLEMSRYPGSNLLHGSGLLIELHLANMAMNRGDFPFLTFGTDFDPEGFDLVVVPGPNRRISWNVKKLGRKFAGLWKAGRRRSRRLQKR